MSTQTFSKSDLENLALGCGFLASGGGGSVQGGLDIVDALPDDFAVDVVDKTTAVNDTDHYSLVVAYIGAPDKAGDLSDPVAAFNAFNKMNEYANGMIKYLIPVELGALSTIIPFAVANKVNREGNGSDLLVIDGDGAGRAVPKLTTLTLPQWWVPPQEAPTAIFGGTNNALVEVDCRFVPEIEDRARHLISGGNPDFDEIAGLAIWLLDSQQLDEYLTITDTVSFARDLGVQFIRPGSTSPFNFSLDSVLNAIRGFKYPVSGQPKYPDTGVLFEGQLDSATDSTSGGFDSDLIGISPDSGGLKLQIKALNESLIAYQDSPASPVAMAPDSICYVTKTGMPFSNADIFGDETSAEIYGVQDPEVYVVALTAMQQLTNTDYIMANFRSILADLGYDGPYIPWNQLPSE